MTVLVILALVLLTLVVAVVYLLGFRLGRDTWSEEVLRLRSDGIRARRQIHDLTRQAFIAMSDEAEKRKR